MARLEISVRPGRRQDLGSILELERGSDGAPHWGEAVYVGILQRGVLEGGEAEAGWDGDVRRLLLVAETCGALAGFAVASGAAGRVELESVLVAEELRRCGIGGALCEAVAAWARELRAKGMDLEVRASSGAGELYRRLGFVVVGRRRAYYRDPVEDAVLMRMELR